ncbi:MAG: T9SS type A sorting domain-containing protein [Saprospiraceae bacterium]|nr:T9SS type A sorting domain-containing protein [Saprospiraceae bacterium]
MHLNYTKRGILLFIVFILNFTFSKIKACDKSIIGPTAAPNNVINSGERGCVLGDFSGSVTVNPGGELFICGQYTFQGSIIVSTGAKVIITAGSSIGVVGSLTFNDFESLEYIGNPSCNAEIYAISTNSCFVTWSAIPGLSGDFCNSTNIYIDGFNFAWGPNTIGLAKNGRAPFLCPIGGPMDCIVFLPINNLDFDAKKHGQSVLLEWSSNTDMNNDYFTIERSTEAMDWVKVDTVHAKRNNSPNNSYSFIDQSPFRSGTYYRIKQTDIDGLSTVTAIKYVSAISKKYNFSVFPNPSQGKFDLSLSEDHNFEHFKIIDRLGKMVLQGSLDHTSRHEIDLTLLNKGVYILTISGQETVISQRILINDY